MKPSHISHPESVINFPVIGIGASAGGLDAFKRFLKAIPAYSGMAYVIVQHLDPSRESLLTEILSRAAEIPVHEITDEIKLAPDHIYVIPANKALTAVDGVLKLSPRNKLISSSIIDVFFTSLAEVHKDLAVGVILSGKGSDGTEGLISIRKHGGITFAQDERSAAFEGMPENARNADVVDFALPPDKIPGKIVDIFRNFREKTEFVKGFLTPSEESAFKRILSLIRQRSNVDFSHYKQSTVRRRLDRRMAMTKSETITDYLEFIRTNEIEQDALLQDLLIPVTAFFRDPRIFRHLQATIFPELINSKRLNDPIRIWSAGCSTGEEAYSLAIIMDQFLEGKRNRPKVQIFATDVSGPAIKKARKAVYSETDIRTVPRTIIENYFTKAGKSFTVNRKIREMCVFADHNFLKDPPFARMDLISCRNVLIYMDLFLQKKALTTFHYSLKEDGFLLLGKSETTGPASDLFAPVSKSLKIYSRNPLGGTLAGFEGKATDEASAVKENEVIKHDEPRADYRKRMESILLSKYTPPAVVVNEQMDIVHLHGNTSPFLQPSQGRPSFNLLKMAREGLAFELRNAMHKAKSGEVNVVKHGIPVKSNGNRYAISIEVNTLTASPEPLYLVLFTKTALNDPGETNSGNPSPVNGKERDLIEKLEKELAQTREDMRSITDDQEIINEELQTVNEELLSSNEEMQSLNEELETSKEELQSTNEELLVVNQELIDKQEQLSVARMYAESVIATIRESLVVLDGQLRIRNANEAFYRKFGITEHEAGNAPFFEVKNKLFDVTGLRSILEKTVPKKTNLDDYEIIIEHPVFGKTFMLVNARQIVFEKSKEQFILIAVEDITERKILEEKRKSRVEELRTEVKTKSIDLEKSNVQLEQFIHTASHEFQEPLRKIMTYSKILQQTQNAKTGETDKSYLLKIEEASLRMSRLVHDTLNFASISLHQNLFEKTDLNRILKNVLFDFELLIDEKKARISSDQLPVIDAIPFQMNQVFYELIYNAIKFSKEDTPPQIHISSRKLAREEIKAYANLNPGINYFEIVFKDNGIGFDQKFARQVFVMFQRLVAGKGYAGTGIGLALCKKIVDDYNGVIFAQGRENKGAQFHVILPETQEVH